MINKVIDAAKELLKRQPYDVAHGLDHHELVWKLATHIAENERVAVDMDVLKVAAYWHDVVVSGKKVALNKRDVLTKETCEYLKKLLIKQGLGNEFIQRVIVAIETHSFLCRPVTNEGRLLWDADKLEGLNMGRWQGVLKQFKSGKMTQKNFELYVKAVKVWLKEMRGRYNFGISRQMHDERIRALLKDTTALELEKEFGVDFRVALN